MSRSNPNIKNPATRFFQWRGGEEGGGRVEYYDKATETSIDVKLPFTFLVLDELNIVSGFSQAEKSSFWSNEVRNITKDTLTVKTSGGTKGIGVWSQLGDVKVKGAKYAKSVYVAFKDETGEFAIGNIKLMGTALSAWIEFQKNVDVDQCAVMITDAPKKDKNGVNVYFTPVFEAREVSKETDNEAKVLDATLQAYLSSYLNRDPDEGVQYATTVDELDEEDEVETVEPPVETKSKDVSSDDDIPLKNIPF